VAGLIEQTLVEQTPIMLAMTMKAYRKMETEGERWSAGVLAQLAITDQMTVVCEELVQRGIPARLVAVYGVKELCSALGISDHLSAMVERVAKYVRQCHPDVRRIYCWFLGDGVPLTKIDEARKLVAVDLNARQSWRLLSTLTKCSARELRAAGQLILEKNGDQLGGGRQQRKGERDPDARPSILPPEALERLRRDDPAMARMIEESMRRRRSHRQARPAARGRGGDAQHADERGT
jgi:hypothetical protein